MAADRSTTPRSAPTLAINHKSSMPVQHMLERECLVWISLWTAVIFGAFLSEGAFYQHLEALAHLACIPVCGYGLWLLVTIIFHQHHAHAGKDQHRKDFP
jgi:hypothetical protein